MDFQRERLCEADTCCAKRNIAWGHTTCITVKQKHCHVPIYSLFEIISKKYLLIQRKRAQNSFTSFLILFFLDPIDNHSILILCNRAVKSEVTKGGSKSLPGGNSQSMLPLDSSSCIYMLRVRRKPRF